MDARGAQVQQQLIEKDAEISRLQRELRVRIHTTIHTYYLAVDVHRTSLSPEMGVQLQYGLHLRSPR